MQQVFHILILLHMLILRQCGKRSILITFAVMYIKLLFAFKREVGAFFILLLQVYLKCIKLHFKHLPEMQHKSQQLLKGTGIIVFQKIPQIYFINRYWSLK